MFTGYRIDGCSLHKYNTLEDINESDDNALTWVHLNYKEQMNRVWIKNHNTLPAIVKKSLRDREPRPRALSLDGGILLVLKGLNFEKNSRPEDMISIRIWIRKKLIISTSNRTLHSISEIQEELLQGKLLKSSFDFLIKLLNKLNYKISEFIGDLNDKIDDLDQSVMQNEPGNIRFELAILRRQVVILKRYLTPQKEVISKISTGKTEWINDTEKNQLYEELDSLTKYLEDLSVIREQTAILNELLMSNISEKIGQRMYKLSIITLIFLPLTFFTGLFGANVGGIPMNQSGLGFGLISLFCLAIVIIEIIIFRRVKWL